jgi:hypothetical protein
MYCVVWPKARDDENKYGMQKHKNVDVTSDFMTI